MSKNKPTTFLEHGVHNKRDLLQRYWLTYKRAHHALLWEVEESKILLRYNMCSKYNTWQLNEALYRYAETSINALFWLFPDKKWKEYPFVHKLLREWRNINHHDGRSDFVLYYVGFLVEGKQYRLPLEYNILPIIVLNGKLKKIVEEQFPEEQIATDATVADFIDHHHAYMQQMFIDYELILKKELPEKFLEISSQSQCSLGGGTYTRFVPKESFWRDGNGMSV